MGLQVRAATSSDEASIVELFTDLQVTIDGRYWERAFSESNPPGFASLPHVVVDENGGLFAYAAARQIELHVEGDYCGAQVLHDFVSRPGDLESEAAGILVSHISRQADVTLCAGAGTHATTLLQKHNFLRAGFFGRAVYDPRGKSDAKRPAVLPFQLGPPEMSIADLPLTSLNEAYASERKVFRRRTGAQLEWLFRGPAAEDFELLIVQDRTEMDAYVVLRKVPGRTGDELTVVDMATPSVDVPRLMGALAKLARDRGLPLFISLFGDSWAEGIMEAGFAGLRPRWPLHWILKDPRHRATGSALLRREAWFFTAADGEIDRW